MKKIFSVLIAMIVAITFAGCGSAPVGDLGGTIKIEDIEWEITEGINGGGDRCGVIEYTNHSKYPIVYFKLEFCQKDDLDNETIDSFYDEFGKMYDFFYDEDEIAELRESDEGISMYSSSRLIVDENESESAELFYFSSIVYMKNVEYCDLVQPDIATIAYIKNGKIYTVYYDFKTQKYTEDDTVIEADQWPANGISKMVPKPDSKMIIDHSSDTDSLDILAYGITAEMYDDYWEECEKKGFTVNKEKDDHAYHAENSDGYELDTFWFYGDQSLSIEVSAPEE